MATDIGGVWRTVGGRRIFIKDGEDLATAMKNSGKFGNKTNNTYHSAKYLRAKLVGKHTIQLRFDIRLHLCRYLQ